MDPQPYNLQYSISSKLSGFLLPMMHSLVIKKKFCPAR